jgi:hypothetical protein
MPTRTANLAISIAAGLGAAALMQLPSSALAQAQACGQKPNIMFCGSTSRTGANLYSGVGPYTEVNGCAPVAATTQALLITRSGTTAGNGAAWLAYLNAGGQIITEYSISAAVYDQIYSTAYVNGTSFGECQDNTMPQVKLNPSNPFWLANPLPVTPAGQGGCGFSLATLVAGEPTVTALGAATGGTAVSFAVRPQGAGRLNLLEADWQDNEASYTATSKTFMGVLISGCASNVASTAVPVNSTWLVAGLASLLALFGMSFVGRRRA